MTRVKICGLTRATDVRRAVELGSWACGFVLTRSRRQVTPQRAAALAATARDAAIAAGRRPPLCVAVFTLERPTDIAAALAASRCDVLQLSAGADGPDVAAVRAAVAARGLQPRLIAAHDTAGAAAADLLLVDGRASNSYGGSGRRADWSLAAGLAADGQLMLAGGLNPENVGCAIRVVRPYAIDVAGGVEAAPGIKNPDLMRSFFDASAATEEATP